MELNQYQNAAKQFAKFDTIDYPFLALAEEVGEVMGKLAKFCRKNGYTLTQALEGARYPSTVAEWELHHTLKDELGDVKWQLNACMGVLNFTAEQVAQTNLNKLRDRDDRGVIVGEGDNR